MVDFNKYSEYYRNTGRLMDSKLCGKKMTNNQLKECYKRYQKKIQQRDERIKTKREEQRKKVRQSRTEGKEVQEYIVNSAGNNSKSYPTVIGKNNSSYTIKIDDAINQTHIKKDYTKYYKFYNSLTKQEKKILDSYMWMCPKKEGEFVFDAAHIDFRSSHPDLASNVDNIILLPRYLHKCLDEFINPFTQKPINKEEHNLLWSRILN